uniref:Ig-like domain-containing protein n=1 Tax=Astyanax mexicanus TaxID=7994 RepID=A0A8B9RN06_ASTMX
MAEDTMRPMFKRLLANIECVEGQSVQFDLRVSGTPPPTLKWEKDGKPLECRPQVEVVQQAVDHHILYIRETLIEDSGTYRVTATNSAGSATATAEVATKKTKATLAAKILTKPQSQTVSLGESVRFTCDIDGEPAPTVSWMFAGRTIVTSQRVRVTTTQYKSTLEISSVEYSDEGNYSVVVENSEGRQEAKFTLTISKPAPKAEVVKSPEPAVKSPEPSVKSPEPSVKSPEPSVKSPEPSVTSPVPSVKSPEPAVTSPVPSVKSPEPSHRPRDVLQ